MFNDVAQFLQDRSVTASIVYGFLFVLYYGLLLALSILVIARFRLRGVIMVGIMLVYALANVTADSLSESVERVRMASNNSVLRMTLVIGWFGILFSCILSAGSRMERRR